ncbi:hypothetical protein WR25_19869 [Diploscapter pachys]|uniref:Uncharacterized protein n=1 Tax=Diploscapter pachys TaxID=2018661 RepID=A0A2A2M6C8_9BILA|nr:hypothetical protein WR25_19869 [Diploscapter pachys]
MSGRTMRHWTGHRRPAVRAGVCPAWWATSMPCCAPNLRCIATNATNAVSTGAWRTTAATASMPSSAGILPAAAAPCWW